MKKDIKFTNIKISEKILFVLLFIPFFDEGGNRTSRRKTGYKVRKTNFYWLELEKD